MVTSLWIWQVLGSTVAGLPVKFKRYSMIKLPLPRFWNFDRSHATLHAKFRPDWIIRHNIVAKISSHDSIISCLWNESLVMWGGWLIYPSSLGPLRIQIRGWRGRWPQMRPRGSVGPSVRAGPSRTPRQSQANHGSSAGHGCVWSKLKGGHVNYNNTLTWKGFLHYWPCVRGIVHRSLEDSPHKGTVLRSLNVVRLTQLLINDMIQITPTVMTWDNDFTMDDYDANTPRMMTWNCDFMVDDMIWITPAVMTWNCDFMVDDMIRITPAVMTWNCDFMTDNTRNL